MMSQVSSANTMYGLWFGTVYSKVDFVKSIYGESTGMAPFSTLALDGDQWSASRHKHFNPAEKVPNTLRIGGWVRPRASPDGMGKVKSLAPIRN